MKQLDYVSVDSRECVDNNTAYVVNTKTAQVMKKRLLDTGFTA